ESNWCTRLCRPLPNHSATAPEARMVSALLANFVRRERHWAAPDVALGGVTDARARAEREPRSSGHLAGDALVPDARLSGRCGDRRAVADEPCVLKDVALLHDREGRGDQGSEKRKPQKHGSCIGSHEPSR